MKSSQRKTNKNKSLSPRASEFMKPSGCINTAKVAEELRAAAGSLMKEDFKVGTINILDNKAPSKMAINYGHARGRKKVKN